jgi:hypothetical protein
MGAVVAASGLTPTFNGAISSGFSMSMAVLS